MSESIRVESIRHHEVVCNYNIRLNTCMGCLHRDSCSEKFYVEPGDYCNKKEVRHAD